MTEIATAAARPSLEDKLFDLTCEKAGSSTTSALLLSSLIVVALWPVVEHDRLLTWLGTMAAILGLNFLLVRRYLGAGRRLASEARKWQAALIVGAIALGLGWGSMIFSFPVMPFNSEPVLELFVLPASPFDPVTVVLMFVLAGVAAYASSSLAFVPAMAIAFLVCSLLPLSIWLFSFGEHLYVMMGLIVLSYFSALLMLSRRTYAMTCRLIEASEESQHLSADLSEKNAFNETLLAALKDAGIQLLMLENGRITYVGNRELAHAAGWTDAEIDAMPAMLDIIHADDQARVADTHRRRLAGEAVPPRYEVALRGPEGERIEYETAISMVPDSSPPRTVAICWEIGERKQAEQDLLLLRRAIDQTSEGYFLMDQQWRVIDANAAACASLGLQRAELLGMTPLEFDPDITQEALEKSQASRKGGLYFLETRHRAKDGRCFPVEVTSSVFMEGKQCYTVSLVRDISERKRHETMLALHEREFRSLAENIPDNVARFDPEGRYLYINPAHERTLGKTSAQVIGTPIPDSHTKVKAAIAQVVATGQPCQFVRQTAQIAGHTEEHEISLVPEFNTDGRLISVLGIGRNMTEIYRMQEALTRSEAELRTLAENLPVAVIRYDSELRRRYLNPIAEQMLCSKAADLLGHVPGGPTVPATPTMLARYCNKMEEVLATDSVRDLEFVFDALPSDQQRHYEVRFAPEHRPDGKPTSVLAIWHDITERKQMEDALRESERQSRERGALLEAVLESSPEIIAFALDRDYRYLAFNEKHRKTMRAIWGKEISTGACMLDIIGDHPDRLTAQQGFDRTLAGESFVTEEAYGDEARSRMYWQTYWAPIPGADGTPAGLTCFVLNVTERKQAEQKLRDALEFNTGIVNTIPDILFEVNHEGRYLNVWSQDPRMQKEEIAFLLGKTPHEVLLPESAEAAMAAIREADATGTSYGMVIDVVQANGELRRYEHSLAKKRGRTPEEDTFLALSRDVTERLRMEEALRHSEQLLRSVIDATPDWIFIKDQAHRYRLVSQGYARALHLTPEDFIGKNDLELGFPEELVKGNPEKGIRGFWTDDRLVLDSNTIQVFPDDPATIDGELHTFHTVKLPLHDAQGKPWAILAFARDISAQKQLETQLAQDQATLRTFFNALPELAWMKDTEGRYLACNPRFESLYGKSEQEILGKTDFDFVDTELAAFFRQKDQEAIRAGHPCVNEEWVTFASDGRQALLETFKAPVSDPAGNIIGVIGVAYDITARRAAEASREATLEALRRKEERLRQSHDLLRALAMRQETDHEAERREIAHKIHEDLAQNLSTLRLYIAMLRSNPQHFKHLHDMQRAIEQAIRLSREMVAALRPTVLDLGITAALHWLVRDFQKGLGWLLETEIDDSITLDDTKSTFLFRAAQELLINIALHAAASTICFSFSRTAQHCRLLISDNGCGFDPTALRGDDALGLVRLYEQALHHGGELIIHSAPECGTTVEVLLP